MNSFTEQLQNIFLRFFWVWTGLVIVMILVIGWFALVAPTLSNIQSSNEVELIEQQRELDRLKVERDRLREVEKDLAGLTQAEQRRLSSVVGMEFDSTTLYADMDELAEVAGVTFSQLSIGGGASTDEDETTTTSQTEATTSSYQEITIQASVAGISSYGALVDFVDLLEARLPLLSLNALTYDHGQEAFSVRFSAFVLN